MNIKDIDLTNPDHYGEIPDYDIVYTRHGDFEVSDEDSRKLLLWLVNKHRILEGKPLLSFNKDLK